jgi:hypothetical protein
VLPHDFNGEVGPYEGLAVMWRAIQRQAALRQSV